MGNKTAYKEERQTKKKKKKKQKRKIKIDLQKKKGESKFWLVPINKKQKRYLSMSD